MEHEHSTGESVGHHEADEMVLAQQIQGVACGRVTAASVWDSFVAGAPAAAAASTEVGVAEVTADSAVVVAVGAVVAVEVVAGEAAAVGAVGIELDVELTALKSTFLCAKTLTRFTLNSSRF